MLLLFIRLSKTAKGVLQGTEITHGADFLINISSMNREQFNPEQLEQHHQEIN